MNAISAGPGLALLAGILTIAGNISAKEWAGRSGIALFLLAMLFYVAGSLLIPFSLRFGSLSGFTPIFSLSTIGITLLIGLLYYREQVTNLQIVGIIIAAIAVVFLVWPHP